MEATTKSKIENIVSQLDTDELWLVVRNHPSVIDFFIVTEETIKTEIENQVDDYYSDSDEDLTPSQIMDKVDEYYEANKDKLKIRASHYLEAALDDYYFGDFMDITFVPDGKY